jgi:hypothetical protein
MNIAIGAPVWGRFRRTELFWRGVDRLRKQWHPHAVHAYVSGSEEEHKILAEQHGGNYIECGNDQLGKKFNAVAEEALINGCDYFVLLGSDDVISPKLADQMKTVMEDGAFYAGLSGLYFIEPVKHRAMSVTGPTPTRARLGEVIGPGRMLSRALMWGMWSNHNQPLQIWPMGISGAADWWMTANLKRYKVIGVDRKLDGNDPEAFLVDVKGTGNLWEFDKLMERLADPVTIDYERVVQALPENEQEILREMEAAFCDHCGHIKEI